MFTATAAPAPAPQPQLAPAPPPPALPASPPALAPALAPVGIPALAQASHDFWGHKLAADRVRRSSAAGVGAAPDPVPGTTLGLAAPPPPGNNLTRGEMLLLFGDAGIATAGAGAAGAASGTCGEPGSTPAPATVQLPPAPAVWPFNIGPLVPPGAHASTGPAGATASALLPRPAPTSTLAPYQGLGQRFTHAPGRQQAK